MKTICIVILVFLLVIGVGLPVMAYDYTAIDSTNSNGLTYLSGIIDNYSPFKNYLLVKTDDFTWVLWIGDITYSGFTFSCIGCDKYVYTYYNSGVNDRYATTYNYTNVSDIVNISNRSYGSVYSNIKGFNNSYGKAAFPISEFCLVLISITLLSFTIIHWRRVKA